MNGHGFRAMARTILDEVLGFRPDFIEHQLAHAVRDPNGRAYNRTAYLPERRKMMQEWADYLDQLKTVNLKRRGLQSEDRSLLTAAVSSPSSDVTREIFEMSSARTIRTA